MRVERGREGRLGAAASRRSLGKERSGSGEKRRDRRKPCETQRALVFLNNGPQRDSRFFLPNRLFRAPHSHSNNNQTMDVLPSVVAVRWSCGKEGRLARHGCRVALASALSPPFPPRLKLARINPHGRHKARKPASTTPGPPNHPILRRRPPSSPCCAPRPPGSAPWTPSARARRRRPRWRTRRR